MHPAFSVIFFTVSSGMGYGLLIMLGFIFALEAEPENQVFLASALASAVSLITVGLLSSTFHLGHPERAWRALSQWRSSWLSREGVLAILTYIPILMFAFISLTLGEHESNVNLVLIMMCLLCLATVYCTSMIYASLKTIHAWCNRWVPLSYLILSVMSGAVFLHCLLALFAVPVSIISYASIVSIVIALAIKMAYWHYIDTTNSISTPETATGLSALGKVSLVQSPHSQDNYLLKEMGYQIARKHATKLRRLCIISAFVLPLLLIVCSFFISGIASTICSVLALVSILPGIVIERWLFFAEAKHTVTLYYGR